MLDNASILRFILSEKKKFFITLTARKQTTKSA